MIKTFTAEEFQKEFGTLFEEDEPKYQLLIGDLKLSLEKGNAENDFFGAIYVKDELEYLLCNYDVYNLLTYPMKAKEEHAKEAAKELQEFLASHSYEIHGFQGSEVFTEAFKNISNSDCKLKLAMDILVCTKLIPKETHGELVKGSLEYLDEIAGMYRAFIIDALHEELELDAVRERVANIITNKRVWMYKVDGHIVGMVMSTREGTSCISFSGVYTKPEYRGKGYCKEFMYLVGQEMMAYKPKLTLFVDKENPCSNAAYEAVGYVYNSSVYAYE